VKHHLVVKTRHRVDRERALPDWVSFISDKSQAQTRLTPDIDSILRRAGREFWACHEYPMRSAEWTSAEERHGLDRTYRLILQSDGRVDDATMSSLTATSSVESVRQLEIASTPLPESSSQPFAAERPTDDLIGLDFAHAVTRGDSQVRVAVLDTGVNASHPELAGKVVAQADFVDLAGMDTSQFVGDFLGVDSNADDELGHGTHVAGIVAGQGLQMKQGVVPDCRLIAVRVLATLRDGDKLQGAGIVDNINPAIKWAVDQGADVINMSLGIRHTGGGLPHQDVIRYALAHGVSVVAASGNDGTDTKYYPGALPGVVAVGAVDQEGHVAPFSSWGAPITVVAPGVNVLSSFAHGRYAVASGTSQASPCVAGSVALLKSVAREQGKSLGVDDVMTVLRETSDKPDGRLRSVHTGFGLINLTDAVKWLLSSLN
jgi:subtilisin family serine protease